MQDILNIEEVIEQTSKLANQQTIDLLLSDAALPPPAFMTWISGGASN